MNQLILETSLILIWLLLVGQLQASELCIRAHFTRICTAYVPECRSAPVPYIADGVKSCNITIVYWDDAIDRHTDDPILSSANNGEDNFTAIYSGQTINHYKNEQFVIYYREDQFTAIDQFHHSHLSIADAFVVQFYPNLNHAAGSQYFTVINQFRFHYHNDIGKRFAEFLQEIMLNLDIVASSPVAVIGNYRPAYVSNHDFQQTFNPAYYSIYGGRSAQDNKMSALLLRGMKTANVTYILPGVRRSPFKGHTLQLTTSTEKIFPVAPSTFPVVVSTGNPVHGSHPGIGGTRQNTRGEYPHSPSSHTSEYRPSTSSTIRQLPVTHHAYRGIRHKTSSSFMTARVGGSHRTPTIQRTAQVVADTLLTPQELSRDLFQRRTSLDHPGEIRTQEQAPTSHATETPIRAIRTVFNRAHEVDAPVRIYVPQTFDQRHHHPRTPYHNRQTSAGAGGTRRYTEEEFMAMPIRKRYLARASQNQADERERRRNPSPSFQEAITDPAITSGQSGQLNYQSQQQPIHLAHVPEHIEMGPQLSPLDLSTKQRTTAPRHASGHMPYDDRSLPHQWVPHPRSPDPGRRKGDLQRPPLHQGRAGEPPPDTENQAGSYIPY